MRSLSLSDECGVALAVRLALDLECENRDTTELNCRQAPGLQSFWQEDGQSLPFRLHSEVLGGYDTAKAPPNLRCQCSRRQDAGTALAVCDDESNRLRVRHAAKPA